VNAIPSESRAPWTRGPGRASFRDVTIITGPLFFSVGAFGRPIASGEPLKYPGAVWVSGTWHAKKASRGVPGARQTAQGRVGFLPRHIASHLGSHRLLSARTSAEQDAERPYRSHQRKVWPGRAETVRPQLSRRRAQPLPCATPEIKGRGARMVPAGGNAIVPPRRRSRGKGVLAV
jgi:hypothetical protein